MTLLLCLALAILALFVLPGRQRIRLISESGERTPLAQRVQRSLQLAGMFDATPSLFVLSIVVIAVILGVIIALATSNPLTALFGPPIVIFGTQMMIYRRQRRFLNRAIDELIPFLNRVLTAVKSGRPMQEAYLDAVAEAKVLREILGESAAKIAAGAPFAETLIETLPDLPLRMWATFVRQVELYEQVGGDVATGIERTVSQINKMLQLQREARADVATQARQQHLIVVMLAAGLFATVFVVEGGTDRITLLFNNLAGIIGGLFGLSVMIGGVWFLNRQIRDIERKLSF